MPTLRDVQATFAGGEMTPALWGRTDIQKYKTGLKTGRNVNIIPQGGARNRPGTEFIATVGVGTSAVRLIPFIAAVNQAYIIELGNFYARFYTNDGQVQATGVSAWVTATYYAPGTYVTNSGVQYYCVTANVSGTFAADLAAGYWTPETAYRIPTPWAAGDLFQLRFTQSADVMYLAHPSYTPQSLRWNGGASWSLAPYVFANGPFMLQNSVQATTITPSSAFNPGSGSIPVTNVVSSGNLLTITVLSPISDAGIGVGSTFVMVSLSGLPYALDGITLTVASVISSTQFTVNASMTAGSYAQSTASLYPKISGSSPGSITLTASSNIFDQLQAGALFQLVDTLVAQTISDALFTVNTHISSSIPCGATWSLITMGTWTGKILVQISSDTGSTWQTVQTLQSSGTNNYQVSGSTGVSQCLLRVAADSTVAWSGTLTIDLTANSFDWVGVVQIQWVESPTSAQAVILTPQGLANNSAKFQWSEGSWSNYRGWPTCVSFYQDRAVWASTASEPSTVWHSKTASYGDFGVSEPLQSSDAFSVVLASRQLNNVVALMPMPQAMIVLTGDSAFGLAPGADGGYSATDIQQLVFDHRGSFNLDPVVIGNEIILIQQMGTIVRNLIYQLAVNGFMGDDISVASQHLFTNYSLVQMAYQQEPDTIIWAVRNDGVLLSCTYDRAQQMNAWTHHDTLGGTFESVACIPNPTLGFNEIWFVVNRGGTRTVEVLKTRDQGTVPSQQWFVDCGTQYNGAPATVISGIPSFLNGQAVAVLADGNVVANGVNDAAPIIVQGGSITLAVPASVVTVGLPIVWDIGLLDAESVFMSSSQMGSLQGRRVSQPRGKIRCWNSRGGYISLSDPAAPSGLATVNGGSFDAIADLMQRDPSVNLDTPLPLTTGLVDADFPGDYSYSSHVCIRGIDPLPFTLLDVIVSVVPGGE